MVSGRVDDVAVDVKMEDAFADREHGVALLVSVIEGVIVALHFLPFDPFRWRFMTKKIAYDVLHRFDVH